MYFLPSAFFLFWFESLQPPPVPHFFSMVCSPAFPLADPISILPNSTFSQLPTPLFFFLCDFRPPRGLTLPLPCPFLAVPSSALLAFANCSSSSDGAWHVPLVSFKLLFSSDALCFPCIHSAEVYWDGSFRSPVAHCTLPGTGAVLGALVSTDLGFHALRHDLLVTCLDFPPVFP